MPRYVWHTCGWPGCGAKALKHDNCQRHRPRTDQDRKPKTEEYRAIQRERERKRRLVAGLPGGWEAT